ncbi:MAG TPA: 50S ribosomal protein L24, partial [Arachnia sp.]|nr:50S ribosomal protein L24 [Arachnia sp.]
MNSLHVKKGDRVKVISGKDKGAIGEIIAVYPAEQRVTVQGVNLVKRHRRESQGANG